jgi:RHS repeat-associated protein
MVQHYTGPLVEETSYYPFGLIQQGISSRAFGRQENKIKYNSIELERGLGLNVYDAQFRELDPQIGRWWQIDPKTDEMLMWSTYASNYDNPIRFADPLGDKPDCCQGLVDFVVGVGQGLKAGAVGLKNFLVRDMLEGQTWKNIGNLALGTGLGTLSGQGGNAGLMLMDVDKKLGTNTFGAVSAAGTGLAQAGNTLLHGTAKERGNITGQILFAVVGTKGVNAGFSALKNAARGAKAAEVVGAAEVAAQGIGNGISKVIDAGKQGKHILGHNNYLPGRSILTENAQVLLDAFHSGNITSSQVINAVKIRVNFGKSIGNYVKDGISTPTTNGIIINSKSGVHIVPSAPL